MDLNVLNSKLSSTRQFLAQKMLDQNTHIGVKACIFLRSSITQKIIMKIRRGTGLEFLAHLFNGAYLIYTLVLKCKIGIPSSLRALQCVLFSLLQSLGENWTSENEVFSFLDKYAKISWLLSSKKLKLKS